MDIEELRKLMIRKSVVQKEAILKEDARFEVRKQVRKEVLGKSTGLISSKAVTRKGTVEDESAETDSINMSREFEAPRSAPEPPMQSLLGGRSEQQSVTARPRYIPLDLSKYTSGGPKKLNKTKGKWIGTKQVDIDYMKKH
jgi:hypothetical protein